MSFIVKFQSFPQHTRLYIALLLVPLWAIFYNSACSLSSSCAGLCSSWKISNTFLPQSLCICSSVSQNPLLLCSPVALSLSSFVSLFRRCLIKKADPDDLTLLTLLSLSTMLEFSSWHLLCLYIVDICWFLCLLSPSIIVWIFVDIVYWLLDP